MLKVFQLALTESIDEDGLTNMVKRYANVSQPTAQRFVENMLERIHDGLEAYREKYQNRGNQTGNRNGGMDPFGDFRGES